MLVVVKMIIKTASPGFTLFNQPTIIACDQNTCAAYIIQSALSKR